MAFWNFGITSNVNVGQNPNDGTGTDIRDAFIDVNNNIQNISAFLAGAQGYVSTDFAKSNITTLTSVSATITNLSTANLIGNTASLTANLTVGNLIANSGIYSLSSGSFTGNISSAQNITALGNVTAGSNLVVSGQTHLTANTYISAPIIPTSNVTYDLGSPTNFFRNIYSQGLVQVNTVSLSAASSILELQTNVQVGSSQDVGILSKYNVGISGPSGNSWAYFGYQNASNNFVYISGLSSDPTTGNSVVSSGVYGNVRFGSQTLSNTTPSTSTTTGALVVAGGAGIAGNLYVGVNLTTTGNSTANTYNGNVVATIANIGRMTAPNIAGNVWVDGTIYSNGAQVLTTTSSGIGNFYNSGATFTTAVLITPNTPSTSTTTGALVLNNGGLGVYGNVTAGAFWGPLNGLVQTASQPGITSVGTLGNLTVSYTTTTNTLQATQVNTTNFLATGTTTFATATLNTLTANSITVQNSGNVTAGGFVGPVYGVVQTAAQTNITSLGTLTALAVTGNVTAGNVIATTHYGNLVGNVSGTVTTANQPLVTGLGNIANLSTNGTTNLTGLAYLNGNAIAAQNTVVTFTSINGTAIGNTSPSTGAFTNLVINGTVSVIGGTITANANLVPSSNIAYNLGSTTAWWNYVYGNAVHAQYADLAENYLTDQEYEPGTVVVVGGDAEVTACNAHGQDNVIGAVSTNPAYLMNGASGGQPIALKGRVPLKVYGPIMKGQRLSTSHEPGYAEYAAGAYSFAIALETNISLGTKIIEAIIL